MPSEIFYSESDDGRLLVAGTDARPKLDRTAGATIPVREIPPGAKIEEPLRKVHQALCQASADQVSAFNVATSEADAAGQGPTLEVIAAATERKDTVKVLTRITGDSETRQRFANLKDPAKIKEAFAEIDAESKEEPFDQFRKRREKERRRYLGGVGR